MNKIKSVLRSSILSATAFISLFSLTLQPVYAQTISLKLAFRKDPEPPIKPVKGTSRGPFCLISPDAPGKTRIIWNTKPFFLWKGDIKKLAVVAPGSKEYLKTQIVTGNQNVNYTGQALEPGKTYRLSIFLSELDNTSPTMFVPFKIMEAPKRNRIGAELRLLEILHKNQGADVEKIAQRKAEYFADKGLWMDALQQAYSVPNPSPELSQRMEDIPNELCK
ncbi:MAG: DUF928 domain-containing protein [Cyanobacteriota bacterium]|nr:DUF928 domain-containing protein [Cyanobacteriota bacterium]